eukprot:1108068-Pelagomonas_calceolata.AAC.7
MPGQVHTRGLNLNSVLVMFKLMLSLIHFPSSPSHHLLEDVKPPVRAADVWPPAACPHPSSQTIHSYAGTMPSQKPPVPAANTWPPAACPHPSSQTIHSYAGTTPFQKSPVPAATVDLLQSANTRVLALQRQLADKDAQLQAAQQSIRAQQVIMALFGCLTVMKAINRGAQRRVCKHAQLQVVQQSIEALQMTKDFGQGTQQSARATRVCNEEGQLKTGCAAGDRHS